MKSFNRSWSNAPLAHFINVISNDHLLEILCLLGTLPKYSKSIQLRMAKLNEALAILCAVGLIFDCCEANCCSPKFCSVYLEFSCKFLY